MPGKSKVGRIRDMLDDFDQSLAINRLQFTFRKRINRCIGAFSRKAASARPAQTLI